MVTSFRDIYMEIHPIFRFKIIDKTVLLLYGYVSYKCMHQSLIFMLLILFYLQEENKPKSEFEKSKKRSNPRKKRSQLEPCKYRDT
jgi:hypothetical protein